MISVALCTCNGEKYIKEQLLSIIQQTRKVDEIIICDDCSTDATREIIEETLNNSLCNYNLYVNKKRLGVTKNFEKSISACKGDFIFLSDQDDIWKKDKVEKIIDFFEKQTDCLFVFTDAELIDSEKNLLGYSLWNSIGFKPQTFYSVENFLGKRFVTGATVAFRKSLLDNCLSIPDSWIHDAWFAINASMNQQGIMSLKDKLILYRQHEYNVIGAKKRSFQEKIIHTYNNLNKSIAFKSIMKNRFISFYKLNESKIQTSTKKKIMECIKFWEQSEKIPKQSFFSSLYFILKNLLNGNYSKFSNGFFGAAVDLIILFKRKR